MNEPRTPACAGPPPPGRQRAGLRRASTAAAPRLRRQIQVRGIVQGVGFRPFVYRLAHELGLAGWVRNDGDGVTIEAEGSAAQLEALRAPPARRRAAAGPRRPGAARRRTLLPSHRPARVRHRRNARRPGATVRTAIGPDTAVCADCLSEMFDPADRRWRYAFTNCTNCGPRYTITRALPYDRAMTSMAAFAMCPACRAEYRNPLDRRFHAEPNACPVCGPRLRLLDAARRRGRRHRPRRRRAAAHPARRDRRHQGPGRLPPRLRRPQRRRGGRAARAQGARGEAAGGDGGQRGLRRRTGRDRRGRGGAAAEPRTPHRAAAQERAARTRCCPASRRAWPGWA